MGILARSVLLAAALLIVDPAGADAQPARTFRLWLFADAHVGTDKANGRDSLATALEQSEGASGFDWDIAFTDGSATVTAQCYLHGSEHAPQGWYSRNDKVIKLSAPFNMPSQEF